MLPLIRDFVADVAAALELPDPIIEFGSLQVETEQDSDLRTLFPGRDYLGTDMREGPGVDRVLDLRALDLADDSVGTAICVETLEHCADPIAAGRELARVVAPGGACLASTPLLLGIHGYPNDYYRYTPEGLKAVLAGFDDVWATGVGDPGMPSAVLAVAGQGRRIELELGDLPHIAAAQREWEDASGLVRIGPFRLGPRELAGLLARELPRAVRTRLRRG